MDTKLTPIKIVLSDVDGVLTDGSMYYTETGDEIKRFHTYDGMGFQMLKAAGYVTGIITTENTKMVERRAKKIGVDYLYQGRRDGGKLSAAMEICEKESLTLAQVAYIGDDVNCKELLERAGLAVCPASARPEIKEIANIMILKTNGGWGALRELADMLLAQLDNQ